MTSSPLGRIRIGVSGWRYPPWRGAFYPKGLPQRRELEYASRVLSSIELNGSFYSLQRQWSGGKELGNARRISPERAARVRRVAFSVTSNTAKDEVPCNAVELPDTLGVTPGRGADVIASEPRRRSRR